MHGARRAHDLPAIGLTDRLVPETHAEGRNVRTPGANHVHRHAGLRGSARAGREHDPARRHLADLLHRHRVVAPHDDLGAKLAEILDEIVREGVVVVDDEQHRVRRAGS
jgi:hypothetical protein